jgi:hypothetical protein
MTAFQLRNRDMHTFEARQQAWRGTSREYADAGWQVSFFVFLLWAIRMTSCFV